MSIAHSTITRKKVGHGSIRILIWANTLIILCSGDGIEKRIEAWMCSRHSAPQYVIKQMPSDHGT